MSILEMNGDHTNSLYKINVFDGK